VDRKILLERAAKGYLKKVALLTVLLELGREKTPFNDIFDEIEAQNVVNV
jgi:hypothetical protein